MISILPAAGYARRMKGIPKFLLPIDENYKSLLEYHIENLLPFSQELIIPTRKDLLPIIKSLDYDFSNIIFMEVETNTMNETVSEVLKKFNYDQALIIMPDTYFSSGYPFLDKENLHDSLCTLACWKIRNEQRGKLGEVKIENGFIEKIIDKDINTGFDYSWGSILFNKEFEQYIIPNDLHIGYSAAMALENGEKVSAYLMDGRYYDCGTPSEYIELLKEEVL